MKNLLRKKSISEKIAEGLASIAYEVVMIFLGVVNIVVKLLIKFRKWEWRLVVTLFILLNAYTTFMRYADAPKAQAQMTSPYVIEQPQSEHSQIVNYITEVFGADAPKAFQLLNCENHALNPLAVNDNTTWGGIGQDIGIFQINTVWQGVTNRAFLYDWRTNIDMAHNIYTRDGSTFKLWTCGRELEI
jgi:hypothetical protein